LLWDFSLDQGKGFRLLQIIPMAVRSLLSLILEQPVAAEEGAETKYQMLEPFRY
jgi:hypothetical protein